MIQEVNTRNLYGQFLSLTLLHYCLNGKTTTEKGAANCQYFKVMKRLDCTHVWDVTHKSLN